MKHYLLQLKMIRPFFFLSLSVVVMGCSPPKPSLNYFKQTPPGASPIIFAPNSISIKGRLEHGISFAPDTKELIFGVLDHENCGKLYTSKKTATNWEPPTLFEPLKNDCAFLPYFSPNGQTLIYASSKTNVNGATDIYTIKKVNNAWESSTIRKMPFSATSRDANASMTNDGTIYFSSTRHCEGKANCHTADLFYSKFVTNDSLYTTAITELASPKDEESVFIAPKEDYILFCRYTDKTTWMDLYISYLNKHKKWTVPRIIDASLNSKDWDRRPFVTIDNQFLFFTRLEIGKKGLTESDIYWANTSKLFKPYVYTPISSYFVKHGEKFEIAMPKDYFKDIDHKQLTIVLKTKIDDVKFDAKKMTLSGSANFKKDITLTFEASDPYNNTTQSTLTLKLKDTSATTPIETP